MPKLKGNVLSLDVETTGLDPYHGARIFCWAYFTNAGEYGYMEKTPENLKWVQKLFNDPRKTIIFHNAKFDLKMFSFEGIDVFNIKAHIDCTLIMSKLFQMNGQHDLRFLSIRYLNRDPGHKDEIMEWLKKHKRKFMAEHGRAPNFSDAPRETVKRRALWDVESTLFLHAFLKPKILEWCAELYETERQLSFVVIDMENAGVIVDITRAKTLRRRARSDLRRIQRDLDELVCPIVVKKKKKTEYIDVTIDSFNANSSALQLPAAFIKLGIKLKYKTKPKKKGKSGGYTGGGNWAFDEYAMIRYVDKRLAAIMRDSGEEGWTTKRFYRTIHKAVKKYKLDKSQLLPPLILKYRQLSKMVSTYYNHIIDMAVDKYKTPTGRELGTLHCNFNQSEAMTGRFSSSKPNFQNMPRILGPRECFIPRKGRRNWHLDYAQVEMKMFVHFAEDRKMAKAIDEDIHEAVAKEIYNKDNVTKEQRKRAKEVNFGIIYGSGPKTMAETLTKKGLPTSDLEASHLVANYHRKFPSVRQITQKLKIKLHRDGFVENPFGRRYHIPTQVAYKALNYLCQGTSADIIKAAMVELWHWLRDNGFRSRIIKTIHDEIVIECPRSEEAEVIPHAMRIMEDLTSYFVPITVDAEINDRRWSDKKDPKKLGLSFAA